MNAKERSTAWAVDQLDPDNWLRIPDFGINPGDVAFEGFSFPIVTPNSKSYGLQRVLREHVKTARALIRKEERSLDEVTADFVEVLDMMDAKPESEKIDMSRHHAMAAFYVIAVQSAQRADRRGADRNSRSLELCYEAIAQCAESVRSLALLSLKGKQDSIDAGVKEAMAGYVDPDLIRKIRTEIATKGVRAKLAIDPKQADKAKVLECWKAWQKTPLDREGKKKYKGPEAFAKDMLKFESLESTQVITRWCRLWKKEHVTQPAK